MLISWRFFCSDLEDKFKVTSADIVGVQVGGSRGYVLGGASPPSPE
jgi:hypothetical protein